MTTLGVRALRLVMIAAVMFLLSACGSTDKVLLTSSRRLNACDGGEPHPVGVRIYYLASTDRFSKADFPTLWENDRQTLEDDRLSVSDVTVVPQSQAEVKLNRPGAAKAVGIVANFCKPGEGCWRQIVPLEGRKGPLRIHLDEGCISLD